MLTRCNTVLAVCVAYDMHYRIVLCRISVLLHYSFAPRMLSPVLVPAITSLRIDSSWHFVFDPQLLRLLRKCVACVTLLPCEFVLSLRTRCVCRWPAKHRYIATFIFIVDERTVRTQDLAMGVYASISRLPFPSLPLLLFHSFLPCLLLYWIVPLW